MGAALTYARRYALFTLVGIAGEDDLDAPDLATPTNRSGPEKTKVKGNAQLNGGQNNSKERVTPPRDGKVAARAVKSILGAEASAELRDRLISGLNNLGSSDDAATWAHGCLPEKNRLATLDAQHVEEAFQARLTLLATSATERAAGHGQVAGAKRTITGRNDRQKRARLS